MKTEGQAVWIDPAGYKRAIARSRADFEADLARQQAAAATPRKSPHRS
jgi:hypothetical protein